MCVRALIRKLSSRELVLLLGDSQRTQKGVPRGYMSVSGSCFMRVEVEKPCKGVPTGFVGVSMISREFQGRFYSTYYRGFRDVSKGS